jgi:hypothetical protein
MLNTMRWCFLVLGLLSGCVEFLPYVHASPCDPIYISQDWVHYWIGSREVASANLVEELEKSGERVRVWTYTMMPFGKTTMPMSRLRVDWNLVREAIIRHNASRSPDCSTLSPAP